MFRRIIGVGGIVVVCTAGGFAQAPAPSGAQAPATTGAQGTTPAAPQAGRGGGRPPAIVSPQVNADKTMTLRFRAPDAKEGGVIGEIDGKPHPMTKGDDGVWTATIGPLAPDVYNYQFNVDGVDGSGDPIREAWVGRF